MNPPHVSVDDFCKHLPELMEVVGKGAKSLPDLKQRDVAQLACIVYEGYFDNIRSRAELCAFILGLLFVLANEMREP